MEEIMEFLEISGRCPRKDSITRTIRISGKSFDKINQIAEENDISFNNVINQIIEFGLEHIENENKEKISSNI